MIAFIVVSNKLEYNSVASFYIEQHAFMAWSNLGDMDDIRLFEKCREILLLFGSVDLRLIAVFSLPHFSLMACAFIQKESLETKPRLFVMFEV